MLLSGQKPEPGTVQQPMIYIPEITLTSDLFLPDLHFKEPVSSWLRETDLESGGGRCASRLAHPQ
jgi:hypothetical protein